MVPSREASVARQLPCRVREDCSESVEMCSLREGKDSRVPLLTVIHFRSLQAAL